ncbi:MAG TPA: glycosyltransferase family A protein [Acidisphaera sp.]|nr:glycosyltransferase family A protein [Acidisphaera sp.]
MILKLGVGIVTYNRRDLVVSAVQQVIAHTQHPFALVVADDGSTDATAATLRDQRVTVVGGPNMGTAWNKNRALFFLAEVLQCDFVILLEDDTSPMRDGWERAWMIGAGLHGMVHLLPDDLVSDDRVAAAGPIAAAAIRSHCAAYSREALLFGGYMDSRMAGCGWETVEHAQHLRRAGYGGGVPADRAATTFLALRPDGLRIRAPASHVAEADISRNRALAADPAAVAARATLPWHDDATMRQFRAEMAANAPRIAMQTEQPPEERQPARRLEVIASDVASGVPSSASRRRKVRAGG